MAHKNLKCEWYFDVKVLFGSPVIITQVMRNVEFRASNAMEIKNGHYQTMVIGDTVGLYITNLNEFYNSDNRLVPDIKKYLRNKNLKDILT
jgi:hypothetical protein